MTPGRHRALFAALAVLWSAAIFAASSSPNPFPFVPWIVPGLDKLVHAAVFALLGALVRMALAGAALRPAPAVLLAAAIATLYGATDELHQMYVPGREASAADLVADALGGLLGASLAGVALRRQERRASIGA